MEEPVDSDRGISVFWMGTLTGQRQRSGSNTPLSTGEGKQVVAAVFTEGAALVVGSMINRGTPTQLWVRQQS